MLPAFGRAEGKAVHLAEMLRAEGSTDEASEAFNVRGEQADYDRVMALASGDRRAELDRIRIEWASTPAGRREELGHIRTEIRSEKARRWKSPASVEPSTCPTAKCSCGVQYYYHVGKNGGMSVHAWQQHMAEGNANLEFVDLWENREGGQTDGSFWQEKFADINRTVADGSLSRQDLPFTTSGRWLAVHHHHRAPGLRYMMPHLRRWKRELQSQGCDLVLSALLREPMQRVFSVLFYLRIPRSGFENYLDNLHDGQLNYLLFNSCEPRHDVQKPQWCDQPAHVPNSSYNITIAEVEEAAGYLEEFDVVRQLKHLPEMLQGTAQRAGWSNLSGAAFAPHDNKTPTKRAYPITPEMRARAASLLSFDALLWDRFLEMGK
jgi:hypothetical protein